MWHCGGRTIFRLVDTLPKIIDWTNGESCILFRGYYHTLNEKKKKVEFSIMLGAGSWRTIFRLLGILPKIIVWTNGERCILFRGVWNTLNKKKKKKSVVFTKAKGDCWRIISRFLGNLPKIIDCTNGERCILSKGFDKLYIKKKKKKSWVFSKVLCGNWRTIFRLLGIL